MVMLQNVEKEIKVMVGQIGFTKVRMLPSVTASPILCRREWEDIFPSVLSLLMIKGEGWGSHSNFKHCNDPLVCITLQRKISQIYHKCLAKEAKYFSTQVLFSWLHLFLLSPQFLGGELPSPQEKKKICFGATFEARKVQYISCINLGGCLGKIFLGYKLQVNWKWCSM